METRILNFFRGYVRIRIIGSSYDRFLNLCAFHGIRLWELVPADEAYEAYISRSDFKRLKAIVRKSHAAVRIVRRRGLPFFIHKYRRRKVYVAGIGAALLFMLWLSAHVWNIRIDGNVSQTDDVIFEYLEQEGIRHGMWKSQVDCQELAADIRNYFTRFSWVAAELKGTRLTIYVKEGIPGTMGAAGNGADGGYGEGMGGSAADDDPVRSDDTAEAEQTRFIDREIGLAAACSGTLLSIYVRRGRALVSAGDPVEPGTLLVSGALPVCNDSQEVVSWQFVEPDADLVIRTERSYREQMDVITEQKKFTGRTRVSYLVRIGTQPFSLPDFFDGFELYDVVSEITQLRLMENFYLPVYIQKFTAKEYEIQQIQYTKEQCEQILETNLEHFEKNLEEKGVQIFENDVKIEWNAKSAAASGILTVGESAVSRVAVTYTEEE